MKICDRCEHRKPKWFTEEDLKASGRDLGWSVRTVTVSPTDTQKLPEPIKEIDLCRECEIELTKLIQAFVGSKVQRQKT